MSICGSQLRGKARGVTCKRQGMMNGRCYLHGGLSPKGQDHYNWTHGQCTKEQRARNKQASDRIKQLKLAMIELGMIEV